MKNEKFFERFDIWHDARWPHGDSLKNSTIQRDYKTRNVVSEIWNITLEKVNISFIEFLFFFIIVRWKRKDR
jgi:hypothetical protein